MEEIIVTVDHDMTNSIITLDTYACHTNNRQRRRSLSTGREQEQYEYDTMQFNSIQFNSRCRLL